MYTLGLRREFKATHALVGGDWGAENQPHSHLYRLELGLETDRLDQHGFVADLVEVEAALDTLLERYADADLNRLPEFKGLNPSMEHFARILAEALAAALQLADLSALSVRLWESEQAWAQYRIEL
jgi:6-pyruvoyltetrahydropterin/6-carboxytetrahydropterin synthase